MAVYMIEKLKFLHDLRPKDDYNLGTIYKFLLTFQIKIKKNYYYYYCFWATYYGVQGIICGAINQSN